MESQGIAAFDASAFKASLGIEAQEPVNDDSGLAISSADKNALNAAADQTPTGLVIPPANTEAIPEYLKDVLVEKPTREPMNWAAELERLTGQKPDDGQTIEGDEVIRIAAERNGYQYYLNQNEQYRQFTDIVNRQYEDDAARTQDAVELIKEQIKLELGDRYTNDRAADELKYFYVDGELTPDGKRYDEVIRKRMAAQVLAWETDAKTQASDYANSVVSTRKDTLSFIDSYEPLGVKLSDDDKAELKDFVLSDELAQILQNPTAEQIAKIGIALNPYLFGKFSLAHFERGSTEGAKRKIARQVQ